MGGSPPLTACGAPGAKLVERFLQRVIMCILALSFSHASAHNESKKAQSTRAPPCLLCLVYSYWTIIADAEAVGLPLAARYFAATIANAGFGRRQKSSTPLWLVPKQKRRR